MAYNFPYKGYKCLSVSGRIYVSVSVKFDELDFPLKSNPDFNKNHVKEKFAFIHELNSTLSLFCPQYEFIPFVVSSKDIDKNSDSLNKV